MSNAAQEPRRWTLLVGRYEVYVVTGPPLVPADGSERVPVIEASAYDALLAERDALQFSLRMAKSDLSAVVDKAIATRSELAALKIENDEADTLNTRLSRILTDTAHVLKGTPEALHSHSWADLAQVAAALKEKAKRLHRESRETNLEYDSCDRCAATWAGDDSASERHAPGCVCAPDFLTTSATESRGAKGGEQC